MAPTNKALLALEKSTLAKNLRIVKGLLRKWMWLHATRSVFPLIGAIFGLLGRYAGARSINRLGSKV